MMKATLTLLAVALFYGMVQAQAQLSAFEPTVVDSAVSEASAGSIPAFTSGRASFLKPLLKGTDFTGLNRGNVPKSSLSEAALILNAYQGDSSIEIPNAYRGDQSVEIPNAARRFRLLPVPVK